MKYILNLFLIIQILAIGFKATGYLPDISWWIILIPLESLFITIMLGFFCAFLLAGVLVQADIERWQRDHSYDYDDGTADENIN